MVEHLPNYDTWKTSPPMDEYDEYRIAYTVRIDGASEANIPELSIRKLMNGIVLVLNIMTELDARIVRDVQFRVDQEKGVFAAVADIEADIKLPVDTDKWEEMIPESANEITSLIEEIVSDFVSVDVSVYPL